MRIVVASDNFTGGVLTHLWAFGRHCLRSGDDVTVISFPHQWLEITAPLTAATEPFASRIEELPTIGHGSTWRTVAARILAARPDVVLLSKGWPGSPSAVLEAWLALRCPLVTFEHDTPPPLPPPPPITWRGIRPVLALHKRIPAYAQLLRWRFPRRTATSSEQSRAILVAEWGAQRDKVFANPYGVDCDLFHPRPEGAREDTMPILGMIGRGEIGKKGIDVAFRALKAVRTTHPGVRLRFYGDDAQSRPGLEALAAECGVTDLVELCGQVRGPDVPVAFRSIDVFLMSSRYEGAPIALIEAMASGLPPVATRVGLAEELIRDGVEGILVDEVGSVDALVVGIRRVLDATHAERAAMGVAARNRVLGGYSVDAVSAALRAELAAVARG